MNGDLIMKIFISYTLRDGKLNREILYKLDGAIKSKTNDKLYIDLIHNSNTNDPQKDVIKNLYQADIVWLIETESVYLSEWVQKELQIAKKLNKPIRIIKYKDFINLVG